MRKSILFFSIAIAIFVACKDDPAPGGTNNVTPGEDGGTEEPGEDGSTSSGGDANKTPPSKVNITKETLDVDGTQRSYVLAVPKTYDAAKKYPIVLVFHGDGGNGPSMAGIDGYGGVYPLHKVSGDDGIIVYPSGQNQVWETYGPSSSNPDHQFVVKLIAAMKAKYSVSKVFAAGWSKGGFFITHNQCRQPDIFEGAVIHAGGVPYDDTTLSGEWPGSGGYQKCDGQTSRTQASMPVMVTHGSADGAVPYDGGEWLRDWYTFLNQCDSGRVAATGLPSPCETQNNCKTGKPVVWCGIQGNGHGIWMPEGLDGGWAFLKSLL